MNKINILTGLMVLSLIVTSYHVQEAEAKTSKKQAEIQDDENEEGSGKAEDDGYTEEGGGSTGGSGSGEDSDPCISGTNCSCDESTGIFTCDGKQCEGGCSVTEGDRNKKNSGFTSGSGETVIPSSSSSSSGALPSGGSGSSASTKSTSELDDYIDSLSGSPEDAKKEYTEDTCMDNEGLIETDIATQTCRDCREQAEEKCIEGGDGEYDESIFTIDGKGEIYDYWRGLFNASGTGCGGTTKFTSSVKSKVCEKIYDYAVSAYVKYSECAYSIVDNYKICIAACRMDPPEFETEECKMF